MNEWRTHDGYSDPPIPGDSWVEVCFRDGDLAEGRMHDWDQNWQWQGTEDGRTADGAIVAYRIIKRGGDA